MKTSMLFERGATFAKFAIEDGLRVSLENDVECAKTFGTYDDFDKGIESVLNSGVRV